MIKKPVISPEALCARDAAIWGDVTIGAGTSVWFHTTIRAEWAPITIGCNSNIQDNCVLHVDNGVPLTVGDGVTVGHGAILHSCTVGDDTVVGMGAIVLNGARIGRGCILGAGCLVTQNTVIPDGMMAFGNPAKVRRPLTEEELEGNRRNAREYVEKSQLFEAEGIFHRPGR